MPEPSRSIRCATIRPSGPATSRARRYSRRSGFFFMTKPAGTRNARGSGQRPPPSATSNGRAKRRKQITAATGLPGRPMNTARPRRPNASGRPGLTAICQKCSWPRRSTVRTTWSSSPRETPPEVITAS